MVCLSSIRSDLNISKIRPILKDPSMKCNDIINIRPISVSNCLAQIFKKLILLNSPELLKTKTIYKDVNNKSGCKVASLDAEKAFDKEPFLIDIIVYADDILLLSSVNSHLQELLNIFAEFGNKWKIKFNTNKSKIIEFGNNHFNSELTVALHEFDRSELSSSIDKSSYSPMNFRSSLNSHVPSSNLIERSDDINILSLNKDNEENLEES
ncbi:unnamed protein product, partial [Brachionus calyciflorus]